MLEFLTIVIMAAVGYAYLVEGLFTAFTMCVSTVAAGLIAFNFYEPLADLFEGSLYGYEDLLCMVLVFALTLGVLRTLLNNMSPAFIEFDERIQRAGGALFGLATGYFAMGFLICALQTIPWHDNFMGFQPDFQSNSNAFRRVLPPDRVWLAMMNRAGLYAFSKGDEDTFDSGGSFEVRYSHYRRYPDSGLTIPYGGEFDVELGRVPGVR